MISFSFLNGPGGMQRSMLVLMLASIAMEMRPSALQAGNKPENDFRASDKPRTELRHGDKHKKNLDQQLRVLLNDHHVDPIDNPPQDISQVLLGRALFFDRILSGNKDTSCATCHHPLLVMGDALPLGVGTGTPTVGAIGPLRKKGVGREFIPRNAPELFNRGSVHWRSQFWDSRVEKDEIGLLTPAGLNLPEGLNTVLEAQAMFPVTSRDEMRGSMADVANGNEIAAIANTDLIAIWGALMNRLLSVPEYRKMFSEAFPDVDVTELGFQHAAKAIAAWEVAALTFVDSPFDEYLRGKNSALSLEEKQGAMLFYGKAGCANCHDGTLLTDQAHYNLAVPQFGPGKDQATGLDFGRYGVTGNLTDMFRFRTPPLRNVTETGPWMHNGAYSNLRDVVEHHLDAAKALQRYNPKQQIADRELRSTVVNDPAVLDELVDQLDLSKNKLSSDEIQDLLSFLGSLTAPNLKQRLVLSIPATVPSGLPIDGYPHRHRHR